MITDCAHYLAGVRQAEPMSVGDAARLAREGSGFVWLASSDPGPDELDELRASFHLPALAVEEARVGHQRPKLEDYGESAFLVVKTVHHVEAQAQIEVGELDIFLGARSAIAISRSNAAPLAGARERLDQHPEVAKLGPMAAAWALLDAVIDDNERVADRLGDHLEQTEQDVFQRDQDQSEPIYLEHRDTERLVRAVHPMLAIFDTLERGEPVESPEDLRPLLRDVGDHARRLSEEIMQLSEALDGLLNANLARVTVRQNVIIQQVSGWAAIAAVPTIITGIYGMNFRHMPELDWTFGYPLAILTMVVAVLLLRWNFRRVGWL
jgi:magnesium transporter